MKNYKIVIVIAVAVLTAIALYRYTASERRAVKTAAAVELSAHELVEADSSAISRAQDDRQSLVSDSASTQIKKAKVALTGAVPSALARATKLHRPKPSNESLSLTLVLKRTDQSGFEEFLRAVQDPESP